MKEIRMDFKTYEKELAHERIEGYDNGEFYGVETVSAWLNCGERLYEFLYERESFDYLCGDKVSSSAWIRIATALGREDELKKGNDK